MTLDEIQTAAVQIADELDGLEDGAAGDDAARRAALRVARACAVALIDELDRLRRVTRADGRGPLKARALPLRLAGRVN